MAEALTGSLEVLELAAAFWAQQSQLWHDDKEERVALPGQWPQQSRRSKKYCGECFESVEVEVALRTIPCSP